MDAGWFTLEPGMGSGVSETRWISVLEEELPEVMPDPDLRSQGGGTPQLHRGMMPPLQGWWLMAAHTLADGPPR